MLTQVLFAYCILMPVFSKVHLMQNVQGNTLLLLSLASAAIAAAGYIINDYFDLNIDRVNKPDKLVIEKIIRRRWAIIWHLSLSVIGIGIGLYLDITTRIEFLGLANFLCAALLFLYSISLKKKLLAGNILISLLTAWVIMAVTWSERSNIMGEALLNSNKILRLTFLYSGFAFIISLVREVVKDMEDMDGDRKYGCRTMPIVWGVNITKVFTAVWLIVLIALLVIIQIFAMYLGWWLSVVYCFVLVIVPLLWIFKELFSATTPRDFHRLSSAIKLVMLTGILSMLFFRYYGY